MKLKLTLFIGTLLLIISCNKKNPELDLAGIVAQIQQEGKFENANFEFIGEPEKNTDSTIKITLENSDIQNFDEEMFGKASATKIYNFSKKTKEFNSVWISINSKKKNPVASTGSKISINAYITKNLIYQSKELE